MPSSISTYRFGAFEVRTRTHELYKHGLKLKVRPQPYQVLQVLLEHAGDVVTREELRQRLWSTQTFVDFEQGLNTSIKELRGVLGDCAGEPRFVETLPRLGYRLIAPVERERTVESGASALVVPEPGAPVDLPPRTTLQAVAAIETAAPTHRIAEQYIAPERAPKFPERRFGNQWKYWALATALLISGVALIYLRPQSRRQHAQIPAGRFMLAVLPFENLTGDPAEDYFSDGMTEEMISQLGRLDPSRLGVIARTSAMHYKHSQETIGQIGSELGVNYVLEGSVRRDANNVRISAQLIQLRDQTHLWAREYDRQIGSLLSLQTEIAQEVADEIQLTLGERTPAVTASKSKNLSRQSVEAYDLYLRGRFFWNKRNKEGILQAADLFRQAIAKDPAYAPAYTGLADSYALMGTFVLDPPSERMPKARAAALKALQLDANLAEAHTSLALITEAYDYDWQTAESEFHRAIELNPNYATAHQWYAEYLMWLGRFDEALQESERARQLDPLSLIIAADRGVILYYSRQDDAALEQFLAVLAVDPHFGRANVINAVYLRKGLYAKVLANIDKDLSHCAYDPWVCGYMVYVYARAGQRVQAERAMQELERLDRAEEIRPEPLVAAHIALGHTDEAFRYLEKEYSERSNYLTTLKVDPIYDPLRADPRFQSLLRRVGLAQ